MRKHVNPKQKPKQEEKGKRKEHTQKRKDIDENPIENNEKSTKTEKEYEGEHNKHLEHTED